ncbi:MAG TPA: SPOR domain-containing protein [Polyangia bacterium]|nr:SPOR domain-containing protein [Polyangia bacterium]
MQDLSRYRKKNHIEIQTRYVSLLLLGSVTLVGLVFALGVLVGSGRRPAGEAGAKPDPLAALDAQSGEPTPPRAREIEMRTFHERLTDIASTVPVPASLADEPRAVIAGGDTGEGETRPVEPKHEESPVLEKLTEAEPGVYSLQVASFDSQDEASELVRRLRRAGHDSFLVSVTTPDSERWYRVRVGPFESKTAAWRYKAAFEERERMPAFVVKRRSRG